MRHRRTVNTMGRTSAHRKATLANLAAALLQHKHIQTTEAKAKVARRFVEKLITLAKQGTLHAHRIAFMRLRQKSIVKILFDDVAPRYKDRNGGYTRVVKLGRRSGDGAPIAVIELIGFETAAKKQKEREIKAEAKKKKEEKREKSSQKAKAEESSKEKKADKKKKDEKKGEDKAKEKDKGKDKGKEKKSAEEKDKKASDKDKKKK